MGLEQEITYFEHYQRCNDLSPRGRKCVWPYYRKVFRPFLPTDQAARILDFGCGAGLLLEWLKSEGYTSVEGVDIDPGQVKFAESLGTKAHLASDSALWLRNAGRYDLIFMTDVLEHIPDGKDIELLCELNNALNSGGRAIIRVPNANASFASRSRYFDSTHRRSYTEFSLISDMQRCGFEEIEVLPDDLWRPRNPKEVVAVVIRSAFRFVRHLEAVSEFGIAARNIPLSQNLISVGRRKTSGQLNAR